MIRSALESDIGRIVEMGKRFRKDSSYSKYLSENPERMTQLARDLIKQNGFLVMEHDGEMIGMLGYIVHSHFISGETVAGEVVWWVEPEHRGEGFNLLMEAEKRARAAGAKYMQMIAPTEKLERIYKSMGFEFVEATYQRAL